MGSERRRRGSGSPGRRKAGRASAACALWCAWAALLPPAVGAQEVVGPDPTTYTDGARLYRAACQNCHGADGSGVATSLVAFEEEVPDFTDCGFASREPDADWVGVAHEGGPVRGFSPMMPAFGGLLSVDQLGAVVGYIRSMCADDAWPRGELNFPRALLTEKAFPEDEWVLETDVAAEGRGSVSSQVVYERRFGARTQIEAVFPFGFRERVLETGESDWVGGVGDVVLGVKRDVFHDPGAGSIVALGAEVKLPTGDEREGLGAEATSFETFLSYGQLLPADLFAQLQAVVEFPTDSGRTEESIWRGAFGRTFTEGSWGRAWTPMVEVQGKRELEGGAVTTWDIVPQLQVTLPTRQHVALDVGVLVPVEDGTQRDVRLVAYLLWEWFDGGLFEGW